MRLSFTQAEASTRLNPFRLVHIPAAVGEIVEAIRTRCEAPVSGLTSLSLMQSEQAADLPRA